MITGPQGTWFNDGTPRPAPVIQHLDIRGAVVVREDGYYPPASFVRLAGKQADHVDYVGALRFTGGTKPPPPERTHNHRTGAWVNKPPAPEATHPPQSRTMYKGG